MHTDSSEKTVCLRVEKAVYCKWKRKTHNITRIVFDHNDFVAAFRSDRDGSASRGAGGRFWRGFSCCAYGRVDVVASSGVRDRMIVLECQWHFLNGVRMTKIGCWLDRSYVSWSDCRALGNY